MKERKKLGSCRVVKQDKKSMISTGVRVKEKGIPALHESLPTSQIRRARESALPRRNVPRKTPRLMRKRNSGGNPEYGDQRLRNEKKGPSKKRDMVRQGGMLGRGPLS